VVSAVAGFALGMVVSVAVVPEAIGPEMWFRNSTPDLGVVLAGIVFSRFVRDAARRLGALRSRVERVHAQSAATVAQSTERALQSVRVDPQARDLLAVMASGRGLTGAERERCRLVEARLRDRIRAPGLDEPRVAQAVWDARVRGVSVSLLDDRGAPRSTDAEYPEPAVARVLDTVCSVLPEVASDAVVTVRLHPRGRSIAATVVVRDLSGVRRIEFDQGADLVEQARVPSSGSIVQEG
jgi:hypothetical protein